MTDRDQPAPETDEPSGEDGALPIVSASEVATEDADTPVDADLDADISSAIAEPVFVGEESGPDDESAETVETAGEPAGLTDGAWTQSTGALLLGALDPADAAAAGQALANDVAARTEIISLLPVADILMSLYQAQSGVAPAPEATAQGAVTTRGQAVPKAERPKTQPVAIPKGTGITPTTILAIGLGVLAALGILWALAQRDQTSTREQEIRALQTRVAELEFGGNASVFVLNPVSADAAGAKATVFYAPGDGTVLLSASGLPELDDDQVYQAWFQTDGDSTWQPGPTFRVNDSGEIVRRLGSETTGFSNMAISVEDAPGSTEPTGDFLLQGALVQVTGQ